MPLEEKRQIYKCRNKYNTLEEVQTWEEYYSENKVKLLKKVGEYFHSTVQCTYIFCLYKDIQT